MTIGGRIVGCIVGGAIGDALGGPAEGMRPPVESRHDRPWAISDDTQLTLATCEAITAAGEVSPERIASRFAIWFRAGAVTGIGAAR